MRAGGLSQAIDGLVDTRLGVLEGTVGGATKLVAGVAEGVAGGLLQAQTVAPKPFEAVEGNGVLAREAAVEGTPRPPGRFIPPA